MAFPHILGGSFDSEWMALAQFMMILCRHSDLLFSADVCSVMVWWLIPLFGQVTYKRLRCVLAPIVLNGISWCVLPFSFLTRAFHSWKRSKSIWFLLEWVDPCHARSSCPQKFSMYFSPYGVPTSSGPMISEWTFSSFFSACLPPLVFGTGVFCLFGKQCSVHRWGGSMG